LRNQSTLPGVYHPASVSGDALCDHRVAGRFLAKTRFLEYVGAPECPLDDFVRLAPDRSQTKDESYDEDGTGTWNGDCDGRMNTTVLIHPRKQYTLLRRL
jgi:hypothetical protein